MQLTESRSRKLCHLKYIWHPMRLEIMRPFMGKISNLCREAKVRLQLTAITFPTWSCQQLLNWIFVSSRWWRRSILRVRQVSKVQVFTPWSLLPGMNRSYNLLESRLFFYRLFFYPDVDVGSYSLNFGIITSLAGCLSWIHSHSICQILYWN